MSGGVDGGADDTDNPQKKQRKGNMFDPDNIPDETAGTEPVILQNARKEESKTQAMTGTAEPPADSGGDRVPGNAGKQKDTEPTRRPLDIGLIDRYFPKGRLNVSFMPSGNKVCRVSGRRCDTRDERHLIDDHDNINGNYALNPKIGSGVIIVDVDDLGEEGTALVSHYGDRGALCVSTPSGNGVHVYLEIKGYGEGDKVRFYKKTAGGLADEDSMVIETLTPKYYAVGAGSFIDGKGTYEILDGKAKILKIDASYEELCEDIARITDTVGIMEKTDKKVTFGGKARTDGGGGDGGTAKRPGRSLQALLEKEKDKNKEEAMQPEIRPRPDGDDDNGGDGDSSILSPSDRIELVDTLIGHADYDGTQKPEYELKPRTKGTRHYGYYRDACYLASRYYWRLENGTDIARAETRKKCAEYVLSELRILDKASPDRLPPERAGELAKTALSGTNYVLNDRIENELQGKTIKRELTEEEKFQKFKKKSVTGQKASETAIVKVITRILDERYQFCHVNNTGVSTQLNIHMFETDIRSQYAETPIGGDSGEMRWNAEVVERINGIAGAIIREINRMAENEGSTKRQDPIDKTATITRICNRLLASEKALKVTLDENYRDKRKMMVIDGYGNYLDLNDGKVKRIDPRMHYYENRDVRHRLDMSCPEPDEFIDFLRTRTGEDNWKIVRDFSASMFLHNSIMGNKSKALFLIGEKNTYKSLIIELIRDILDKDSVSNAALQVLGNDVFGPAQIADMALNYCEEEGIPAPHNMAQIKDLVTKIDGKVRRMQKDKQAYVFRYPKLIFAGNDVQQIGDEGDTNSIFERFQYVTTRPVKTDREPQWRKTLAGSKTGQRIQMYLLRRACEIYKHPETMVFQNSEEAAKMYERLVKSDLEECIENYFKLTDDNIGTTLTTLANVIRAHKNVKITRKRLMQLLNDSGYDVARVWGYHRENERGFQEFIIEKRGGGYGNSINSDEDDTGGRTLKFCTVVYGIRQVGAPVIKLKKKGIDIEEVKEEKK